MCLITQTICAAACYWHAGFGVVVHFVAARVLLVPPRKHTIKDVVAWQATRYLFSLGTALCGLAASARQSSCVEADAGWAAHATMHTGSSPAAPCVQTVTVAWW